MVEEYLLVAVMYGWHVRAQTSAGRVHYIACKLAAEGRTHMIHVAGLLRQVEPATINLR